jgi:hypothetical protein
MALFLFCFRDRSQELNDHGIAINRVAIRLVLQIQSLGIGVHVALEASDLAIEIDTTLKPPNPAIGVLPKLILVVRAELEIFKDCGHVVPSR